MAKVNLYRIIFKRFFDLFFSLIAFMISFPIIFMTGLVLMFSNRGKIFFIQERPGKNLKIFRLIKFKTMNERKDKEGNLLPDAERITIIGKLIRSLSLDELPQLINILKGNMSIIGPRPLLIKYIPLYNENQMRRHEVRPGITGWAQVNGRNDISWKKKLELDVWYVDNISFWLDIKIILLTIKKVLLREGISKSGFATTEPFNGNN